ncbi:hypothetical protein CERSUDRAFT_112902 [Gelatoporia subvermispora B]|uniref:RING-type domain-containing protein n=1 Tax=Ceriporiopsis subvermispora (strain B) TaxID=914234 RepID=M2R3W8_CERS8|nr:hypothetical protein CERSUDRAFT_112902 [Gelatoporia subvermispora B]
MNCSICLDDLKDPVSTPCGHIHCEKCLIAHVDASSDGLNASCPTCRAEFCIAIPDLRFVSLKHHQFIMPGVRRVFLDGPSASSKALEDTITVLSTRVRELERDKTLLLDRCEAALIASSAHAEGERAVRLQVDKLKKEMQELRGKYDNVKRKYKEMKDAKDSEKSTPDAGPSYRRLFPGCNPFSRIEASSIRPMLRIQKRPRLLGSPFDPEKARANRSSAVTPWGSPAAKRRRIAHDRVALVPVEDEDDSSTAGPSSASGSSRTHTGDIFSPSSDPRDSQPSPVPFILRSRRLD